MLRLSNNRPALCALAFTAALAGCSTPKDFYATGGSRADGVVDVAYDFGRMETPVVDKRQAYTIAKNKCSLWGYSDAEPFGGQVQTCEARSGFGECSSFKVSIKYQCLGSLERPTVQPNYMSPASPPRLTAQSLPSVLVTIHIWKPNLRRRNANAFLDALSKPSMNTPTKVNQSQARKLELKIMAKAKKAPAAPTPPSSFELMGMRVQEDHQFGRGADFKARRYL